MLLTLGCDADMDRRTFDVKHDMTFEDYLAKLKAMVENGE